eukprot:scpid99174/ scgid33061/ 
MPMAEASRNLELPNDFTECISCTVHQSAVNFRKVFRLIHQHTWNKRVRERHSYSDNQAAAAMTSDHSKLCHRYRRAIRTEQQELSEIRLISNNGRSLLMRVAVGP